MPRRFDLIVFDWDGTLVDSTRLIVDSICAASADVGLPVPEPAAASGIIGLGLAEAMETLFGPLTDAQMQQMVARYRHHYFAHDHEVALFDGVAAGLPALSQAGHKLGVATAKGRRGLNASLERSGLARYFDATRCVDECFSKPHPQMLLELMDELGTAPERTLMIGDTSYDMQMAQNAQVASVAVSYGAQPLQSLLPFAPMAHFDNFAKLHQWLIIHG